MIGQDNIKSFVETNKGSFPHFVILLGSKGSGKKTLAKYIASELDAIYTETDIKVDEIRSVIDTAYSSKTKVLYCIADADNMRNEAKNAILKISEEPPKNAYFIITLQDDTSMLDTWKSRAYVFNIQPYTDDELKEYYKQNYTQADSDMDFVCDLASTPYEVDKIIEYGGDFVDYVELVIDNIAEVQPANAFKSSSKLALKNDSGYDLTLFFSLFNGLCIRRIKDDVLHYSIGALVTLPFYAKSKRLGVNKQQLYDMWVLKLREEWA